MDAQAMAARPRAGAGVAAAGKESGGGGGGGGVTAGGGLSLSSTASNDTGYSSIGNSGERAGPNRATGVGDLERPSSACRDEVDVELRPSVAELRQRFQTHSVSQPAELSKRCVDNTFLPTPPSTGKTFVVTV